MEIITRRLHIRPNLDQDFYRFTEELQSYIDDTYVKTGKRISLTWEYSEDLLTHTIESHWVSEEAFQEFLADPKIIESGKLMQEYNTAYGIVQGVVKQPRHS